MTGVAITDSDVPYEIHIAADEERKTFTIQVKGEGQAGGWRLVRGWACVGCTVVAV